MIVESFIHSCLVFHTLLWVSVGPDTVGPDTVGQCGS